MRGVLERISQLCSVNRGTCIPLVFGGDTWQTWLVLESNFLHTSPKFKLACRAMSDEFNNLPDQKIFREFVAAQHKVDVDALLKEVELIKKDKCKECAKKIPDYFKNFNGTYSDFYKELCTIHRQIDEGDTQFTCRCFSKNYPFLRLRYDDEYQQRVEEVKNMIYEFMDDGPLAEDMTFIALEYWDAEANDLKLFLVTSTERIAAAAIPKLSLIAYVLDGRNIKQYNHTVTIDDDLQKYVDSVSS